MLRSIGVDAVEIRLPAQLAHIDALIIPGGESTTITRLLDIYELREPIRRLGLEGLPIWGTCAGAIVLAKQATDLDRPNLALMDIDVRRNAFGRQLDSFEADLNIPALGDAPFHAVFIRAPVIERTAESVEVLATLADGTIVAAREGDAARDIVPPRADRRRPVPQTTGRNGGGVPPRTLGAGQVAESGASSAAAPGFALQ